MTEAPDYYYEFSHRVLIEYRQVIAEMEGDEGVSRAEAKSVAAERIRALVDDDEIKIPVDAAIMGALDEADRRDNGQADKVLERIIKGEDALDFDGDPALSVVVALGAGRRKTLRSITEDDMQAMDQNKYKNMRAAANAYDDWRNVYDRAVGPVKARGSLGAAVEAGDFR